MSEPIRILVAEDHLVARVGVTTIVNMQPDMTVVAEAANGQQAVEMYRKHLPDVALLDMRMPVMGGVEAATAIRARIPQARMIALTTYGGDEDIRRALAAGRAGLPDQGRSARRAAERHPRRVCRADLPAARRGGGAGRAGAPPGPERARGPGAGADRARAWPTSRSPTP